MKRKTRFWAMLLVCVMLIGLIPQNVEASYSKKAPKLYYDYSISGNTVKMKIKNRSAYSMTISSCNLFSQEASKYNLTLKKKTSNMVIKSGKTKTLYFKIVKGEYSYDLASYEFKMTMKWHGKNLYVEEVAYDDCTGDAYTYLNGKWIKL